MDTLSAAIVIAGLALLLVVGAILLTFFDGRKKTTAEPKYIAGKENVRI